MSTYETSATVEEHGRVLVAGVPFAPGTEVAISISPKVRSEDERTYPDDEALRPNAGLRWEGNVLVHQGLGAGPSAAELRNERLDRLGEGRAG
ncbi:MAG: hypothetical protein L0215_13135 [Gemmataceae bacterium]|nr:hypothetical protein [Gemmataceae bacterium]